MAMLEKAAIEGMLQVIDEQSGLAGSKVVTRTEFEDWKRLGNVVNEKDMVFEYKFLPVVDW